MSYPHKDVVNAWMEGKAVQVKDGTGWVDYPPQAKNPDDREILPVFSAGRQFRIKPPTLRSRRFFALNAYKQPYEVRVVNDSVSYHAPEVIERQDSFGGWIDNEWQESTP